MEAESLHTSGLNERARIIDALVNTYRELNTKFRPLGDDLLRSSGAREIIERMRMDEMLFAQALKERVTGVGTVPIEGEDELVMKNELLDDSTTMVISQFGNARATTLSLLKEISEGDWTKPTDDGMSIFDHAQELAESDRNQLEKLSRMVAGR